MISKELLSEVFEQEIRFIKYVANNTYEVHFEKPIRLKYIIINIYELAHKCKEWAYENNYYVYSTPSFALEGVAYIVEDNNIGKRLKTLQLGSEVEAVIKACEWILDNKEIK